MRSLELFGGMSTGLINWILYGLKGKITLKSLPYGLHEMIWNKKKA